jgi:hypothetical protein
MSIEAMKQALEALERSVATCFDQYAHQQAMSQPDHFINQAITSLRQAIAEAEKQEPVAWMHPDWPKHYKQLTSPVVTYPTNGWKPLYTHPQPKRKWVGLTDEEVNAIDGCMFPMSWARKIEAKLKDKNGF